MANRRPLVTNPAGYNEYFQSADTLQVDGSISINGASFTSVVPLTITGSGVSDLGESAIVGTFKADEITVDINTGDSVLITLGSDGNITASGRVNATSVDINSSTVIDGVLDEDTLVSNSDTKLATQQSIKTYVDDITKTVRFAGDTGSGDIESGSTTTDTLTIAGTVNQVETAVSGDTITISLSSSINLDIVSVNSLQIAGTTVVDAILDEDDFTSNSNSALATQQSIKVKTETYTNDQIAAIPNATQSVRGFMSPSDKTKIDGIEDNATRDQTGAEIKALYEQEPNAYTDTKDTKLAGIEEAATADQTAAEIRTLVDDAIDSNVFTDADHTKLDGIENAATADQTGAEIKALYEAEPSAFTDAQFTKLAGIEDAATADQTGAEIKSLYEAEPNAYTDTKDTKLAGIEDAATADQTAAEIRQLVDDATDSNVFTDADHSKLDAIEAGAEVNVPHDLSYNATSRALDITNGTGTTLPEATVSTAGLASAADKSKLDGIEIGATADQTAAEIRQLVADASDSNVFTDAEQAKLADITAQNLTDLDNLPANLANKADLIGGKLDPNQVPDVAITEFIGNVATEADLTTLSGQSGDWATVTNEGKVYIITANDGSSLSDWTALLYPATIANLSYDAATRTVISTGGTDAVLTEVVVNGNSGLMTGTQADKLNNIEAGAQVNVPTDLTYDAATRTMSSSTGANAIIPHVVASGNSGLISGTDKERLESIVGFSIFADNFNANPNFGGGQNYMVLEGGKGITTTGNNARKITFDIDNPNFWTDSSGDIYYDAGNVAIGQSTANRRLTVNSDTDNIVGSFISTNGGAYVSFSDNATSSDTQVRIGSVGNEMVLQSAGSTTLRLHDDNSAEFFGDVTFATTPDVAGSTMWHSGNDGSGSGLDADLLDGVHASSFIRSDANDTVTGKTTWSLNATDSISINKPATNQYCGMTFREVNDPRYLLYVANSTDGRLSLQSRKNGAGFTQVFDVGVTGDWIFRVDPEYNDGTFAKFFKTSTSWTDFNNDSGFTSYYNLVHPTVTGGPNTASRYFTGIQSLLVDDPKYGWEIAGEARNNFTEDLYVRKINNQTHGNWARIWTESAMGSGSGLDADLLDGQQGSYYAPAANPTFDGVVTVGDGTGQDVINIKKADNNASDHIRFFNGTTRVGEIGCEDTTWLRINQETNKNIYTPRYIRADAGFFVDGTAKGINGSGNFIGGTISGASDVTTANTVSTVVKRNTSGDINCRLIRQEYQDEATISGGLVYRINNSTNNYLRTCNDTGAIRTFLGVTATGADASYLQSNASDIFNPSSVAGRYIQFNTEAGITGNTSTGNKGPLAVYQATAGKDAFMTFHIAGDYAAYFGLDGTTNDLFFGGWSRGAAKYRIWHQANDGSGSGLDADLLDGQQGSFYAPVASPTFTGDLTIPNKIIHAGDTDTYFQFHGNNTARMVIAGAEVMEWGNNYVLMSDNDTVRLGTGSDFRMWFNGNDTIFRSYAHANGDIIFQGETSTGINRNLLQLKTDTARVYCIMHEHNAERFRTTSAGVTVTGQMTATGDVVAFSDARVKKNIEVIPNALEKVQQIRGVTFQRTDIEIDPEDEENTTKAANAWHAGVIAQEVEKVLPEVVSEDANTGIKQVAYGNLVSLLIEAVKEQQSQIEALTARVSQLENN